jgi:hypothetical protein
MNQVALAPALALLVAGCASSAPKPDDMSAAAHRGEADRERTEARALLSRAADPARSERPIVPGVDARRGPWVDPYPEVEKQGPASLQRADVLLRHAREHERAAAELERFEEAECRELPAASRAACPLLHDVVGISDIPGGVRIVFADAVAVPDVVAHIRCHLAYARARAYAGAEDCPLYVRGVEASADGGHAILLRATHDSGRGMEQRIRELARQQAVPGR